MEKEISDNAYKWAVLAIMQNGLYLYMTFSEDGHWYWSFALVEPLFVAIFAMLVSDQTSANRHTAALIMFVYIVGVLGIAALNILWEISEKGFDEIKHLVHLKHFVELFALEAGWGNVKATRGLG